MKINCINLILCVILLTFLVVPTVAAHDQSPWSSQIEKIGNLITDLLTKGETLLANMETALEAHAAPFNDDEEKKSEKRKIKVEQDPKNKASLGVYIDESDGKVRIIDVVKGGPADKAGLQANDVILTLSRKKIASIDNLMGVMAGVKPGEDLDLMVKRGDEKVHLKVVTENTQMVFADEELEIDEEEEHPHEHGLEESHHGFLNELLKSGHDKGHAVKSEDKDHFEFKSDDGTITVLKGSPGKEGKKIERRMKIDLDDFKKGHHEKGVTTKTKRIKIPGGEAIINIRIITDGDDPCDVCDFDFDFDEIDEAVEEEDFEFHSSHGNPHEGHNFDFDEDHDVFMFKGDGDFEFHPLFGQIIGSSGCHNEKASCDCQCDSCKTKSSCKTRTCNKSKCSCKG
ncbi:MAG: PDZ domain-containing protein, partial [Planctomycetes bacterium]|nr:PDZ domain-containing protein [Planctomycetota bacterium]